MSDSNHAANAPKRDIQGRYLYKDYKIVPVRGGFIIEGDESGTVYKSVHLARKNIDGRRS